MRAWIKYWLIERVLLTTWCCKCFGTVNGSGNIFFFTHVDMFGRSVDGKVRHRSRTIKAGYVWERWYRRIRYLLRL